MILLIGLVLLLCLVAVCIAWQLEVERQQRGTAIAENDEEACPWRHVEVGPDSFHPLVRISHCENGDVERHVVEHSPRASKRPTGAKEGNDGI